MELLDVVTRYRIQDLLDFRSLARKGGEVADLATRLLRVYRYEQLIQQACKDALFLRPVKTYKERLHDVPCIESGDALTLAWSFWTLFTLNGFEPIEWRRIFQTLMMTSSEGGKRHTIYLQGPPNCGKTSVMLLLSSIYDENEIGNFGPQATNSQFWLDNLHGKELYLGDEAKATPLNIQTLLLLLEGNSNAKTEIKNGEKVRIEPKPVIMACNMDIWSECQGFAGAIKARIVELRFRHPCPIDLSLRRSDKKVYQQALRMLIKWANQPTPHSYVKTLFPTE